MAQRVFLIRMPIGVLERTAASICGDATARAAMAAELATTGAPHLRRVTVSEMVVNAAERTGALSSDWLTAHNCMPFLIAAKQAEQICEALRIVEGLKEPGELEDFFTEQARTLDMKVEVLDRDKFVVPEASMVEKWIHGQLDRAAALRLTALNPTGAEKKNPLLEYALSMWVWLGRIFARTRPCFWQGRNRWLGGAAFPELFDSIKASMTTVTNEQPPRFWSRIRHWFGSSESGPESPRSPELERFIERSQEQTRKQLASKAIAKLRPILVSTADLVPALAVPGWAEALPKQGHAELVTGAVMHDQLDNLVAALRDAQASGDLPYEAGNEWAEVVVAAAMSAKQAEAHLVEGDDTIRWAYRWPAIPG